MTNNIATIARNIANADKKSDTARASLVEFIKKAGGISKKAEREFDVAYIMAKLGLRSEKKTNALFERGAFRPDNVKTAMAAARKVRQRARKDAGVDKTDNRGGARPSANQPEPKKAAATMIPSAVSNQEAAAFLLAYANKNAKVLPVKLINAINDFANKK